MMSNDSKRVKQQLFAVPAACAVVAAVLWPVSYVAAQATGWIRTPTGTFGDLWTGSLAVVTFIGASTATLGAIGGGLDGIYRWFRE